MSKNKLAKFVEMETFSQVFQMSAHEILEGKKFELKGKWNNSFFNNNNAIVLELGCGRGEYTVQLAEKNPHINYIGVDIKGARIWTGAKKSIDANLKNVAFIRTDIEMINHFFAENEVNEIWFTFPDPQMKKVNKRLTSTNFLRLYQQFLVANGLLHLKTDSNFMFSYTCALVDVNNFPVVFSTNNLYANKLQNEILDIKTFYEKQWISRGISIKYINFRLIPCETYLEPDIEIEKDDYRSFGRNAQKVN
jgi:tRNA (guanine-N7-)-methyltransferase